MSRWAVLAIVVCALFSGTTAAQVLDKQKLLDAQSFWDNRDWDWYREHIPFFECPDADINTTYYYRWELVTKHLTYGSPNSGYTFTEFIDRPFWSGRYGAISCPAGHQLYEVRWLRRPQIARDFARYWFGTEGAQPRRYSCWLADAVWALHEVHPDRALVTSLLREMVENYEGWTEQHFVPEVGLFWQTGHDDGMEININSRQTQDTVRGAAAYRPTLNSYLWADALAIARVADLAGDRETAEAFRQKAAALKENLQKKLWDTDRNFFFPMSQKDEKRDGHVVKALSLTYQTGRHAGSRHGREQIGYVPWQFNLPDAGYESAWKFLMDRDYFYSDYGPTTVERRDPMFLISKTCCVWSGQSWPYATTQTLKAMANLLQNYKQDVVTRDDYYRLLSIYAKTHRKGGRPYIAEAAHPDTGSWDGHDAYNHSEHYFHSGYVDLIVTGLVGLRPRDDDVIEVHPLAPAAWDYFALEDVMVRGRSIAVVWDKHGTRYELGRGLHLLADGKKLATAEALERLSAQLPVRGRDSGESQDGTTRVNFAVNNDGHYYPKAAASFTDPKTSVGKIIDGNYWYHAAPPNRWTCEGSTSKQDWLVIDLGVKRRIDTAKLYILDDGDGVAPPAAFELEYRNGGEWKPVPGQVRKPAKPTGRRANVVQFPELETQQMRVVLTHATRARTGLSEIEFWGNVRLPVEQALMPAGNLAHNSGSQAFPKATASFTSRFDQVAMANDGVTNFNATPHNRWTSYESPNETDWLAIDFGEVKQFGRVELAIYDDGGGVQAPLNFTIEYWDGIEWRAVKGGSRSPTDPVGGQYNEVRFEPIQASKVRVVFRHRGKAKSGISEILIWPQ
jgi:hypothetical protein